MVVITLASLLLAGCENDPDDNAWWEQEREKIELSKRFELLEYRYELAAPNNNELTRLQEKLNELNLHKRTLLQKRSALDPEIKELERRCDDLIRLTIQGKRMGAIGRKFVLMPLNDGRVFHNVSITDVDDGGVAIRHQNGAARLHYADLSPEQRDIFGLDEESALVAQYREMLEALAYEKWIEQGLHEKQDAASALATRDEENASRSRSLLLAQAEARERMRPLSEPATHIGSRSWSRRWSITSRNFSYRPAIRYVYYYPLQSYGSRTSSQGLNYYSGMKERAENHTHQTPNEIKTRKTQPRIKHQSGTRGAQGRQAPSINHEGP